MISGLSIGLEQQDGIYNVLGCEENVGAVKERVTFVIREPILSSASKKH
jgi:hypothetical protein